MVSEAHDLTYERQTGIRARTICRPRPRSGRGPEQTRTDSRDAVGPRGRAYLLTPSGYGPKGMWLGLLRTALRGALGLAHSR
jgi:hypothetical protein